MEIMATAGPRAAFSGPRSISLVLLTGAPMNNAPQGANG